MTLCMIQPRKLRPMDNKIYYENWYVEGAPLQNLIVHMEDLPMWMRKKIALINLMDVGVRGEQGAWTGSVRPLSRNYLVCISRSAAKNWYNLVPRKERS